MATFIARILGAARLDRGTYEEVERDTGATSQALAVVLLASAGIARGTWRSQAVLAAGCTTGRTA